MGDLAKHRSAGIAAIPTPDIEHSARATFVGDGSENGGSRKQRPFPHNLTQQPGSLLGRDDELERAREQLCHGQTRLLTLTGPAGVGKTRLAHEIAADLLPCFPDGVWFVDLSDLPDPVSVTSRIATALGIRAPGQDASIASLRSLLCIQKLLLVLDSFDQVLPHASEVASLLAGSLNVRMIVTSRSRLHLRWEHVLPVGPLPYPCAHSALTFSAVCSSPSVELFVERARASCPTFALTVDNMLPVVKLCQRLEGLPLAIEMAADRAGFLDATELLEWLEQPLPALSWEVHDAPSRQHSLRGALDWSYSLLSPEAQVLCRRLGVFVGGWTMNAAARVTQLGEDSPSLADRMSTLADSSFILVNTGESQGLRCSMLKSIREFAVEQMDAAGELEEIQEAHARFYGRLARSADRDGVADASHLPWKPELECEHENFRVALEWALKHGEVELEQALTEALARGWWLFGNVVAGNAWLVAALARGTDEPHDLRIASLQALQELAISLSPNRIIIAPTEPDPAEDHGPLEVPTPGSASSLSQGSSIASGLLEHALAHSPSQKTVIPWGQALNLHGLGLLSHAEGETASAVEYFESALTLYRVAEDPCGEAYVLGSLATEQVQRDPALARQNSVECLKRARDTESNRAIAWCIYSVIACFTEPGSHALVGLLSGLKSHSIAEGLAPSARQRRPYLELAVGARAAIGESAFAEAWSVGQRMTSRELVNLAIESLQVSRSPTGSEEQSDGSDVDKLLSPREQQVLELAAQGLTNKQIAGELIISVATVNYHITSVLTKLDAENRTQAVTIATKRGLL
jgi:non-specific serine/threonine protein kinase